MYKKSPQGWLKHWDFILLDIFCLQLAFVVAYLVRQGLENPYSDQIYRTVAFVFMMLHFLAFKIVIFIQIIIGYGKINDLKSYPCYIVNSGWWLVYSIVGVLVPLWINYLYQRIKKLRIDK